jgi:SNF2 family DNA or RNA helicase
MDLTAINAYLTRIRTEKAADLKPCGLVTDRFISSPPHNVGVAHLILRPRMLLGDPTGTGKSPQALVAYAYLKEKAPSLKMLVVTTQAAQFQWVRAVEKFLAVTSAAVIGYARTPAGTFANLGPSGRAQQWPSLMGTDIWVTTYAMMAKEHTTLLHALDTFVLVLDESQTLKSHKGAVLYPAAQRLSAKARAVWGLSATPMMNDKLDELYSVMELIRPGTFGDYPAYRKTYYKLLLVKPKFKKQPRAFYKVLGYQNLALLRSQVDPFFLRRPVNEFQQYLPPVSFQQLDVPLDRLQRGLYTEIIGKHWPISKTPIQQLASLTYAQLVLDAPALLGFTSVPSAKEAELLRLLTESLSDQQVIVYSRFAKVVRLLSAALTAEKIPHGVIAGGVSPAQRDAAAQAFQKGQLPVMLITSAGAQALDLQAASTVICYDLPWSWGEFRQIIGRARRIGSLHACINVILLCGYDTLDSIVADRLTSKEDTIRTVLGASDSEARLSDRVRVTGDLVEDADDVALPGDDLRDLFTAVRAGARTAVGV